MYLFIAVGAGVVVVEPLVLGLLFPPPRRTALPAPLEGRKAGGGGGGSSGLADQAVKKREIMYQISYTYFLHLDLCESNISVWVFANIYNYFKPSFIGDW